MERSIVGYPGRMKHAIAGFRGRMEHAIEAGTVRKIMENSSLYFKVPCCDMRCIGRNLEIFNLVQII